MTPALQLLLLLTVGQNMMTWSDPAPEPLDQLHVHLHLMDEDKQEMEIDNSGNRYLVNSAGNGDDNVYSSDRGENKSKCKACKNSAWPAPEHEDKSNVPLAWPAPEHEDKSNVPLAWPAP